jgi:hypothetical protein
MTSLGVTRIPEYTRTQTVTFDVKGHGHRFETLHGDDAVVESIDFVHVSGRGDTEPTRTRIVLRCLTEYDVEYTHTIRAERYDARIPGLGYHWLDTLAYEAWKIAVDDADAW